MPFHRPWLDRLRWPLACLAIVLAATVTFAQRFVPSLGSDAATHHPRYDGKFALARLIYTTGPGGYYYQGLPAWKHGYPTAELNLTQILNAITAVHPHLDEPVALAMDDPELTKYPVAFMTEAGYWVMSDKEAAAFRAYLLRGGFVIFDDFRPPPRGGGGWENFAANMERVLPGVKYVRSRRVGAHLPLLLRHRVVLDHPAVVRLRPARLPRHLSGQRSVQAPDRDHQLQHRRLELLGILRHRPFAGQRHQSGVPARRELHHLRPHTLSRH